MNETLHRILLIEDDRKLCRLMVDYFQPLGFALTAVHDGPTGLDRATTAGADWDAVILDVMLPGMDGFEVLRRIRQSSEVPVLMLTSRGDETDRIVGLEVGADDYIPKTYSTRELLARLRAVLRRAPRATSAGEAPAVDRPVETIVAGPLAINIASREVTLEGAPVVLTAVEFDLLACLARARGRVKTRDDLYAEIREREYDVFDRSIDVHISILRKKLGDEPRDPRFIGTVRSVGYKFIG